MVKGYTPGLGLRQEGRYRSPYKPCSSFFIRENSLKIKIKKKPFNFSLYTDPFFNNPQ